MYIFYNTNQRSSSAGRARVKSKTSSDVKNLTSESSTMLSLSDLRLRFLLYKAITTIKTTKIANNAPAMLKTSGNEPLVVLSCCWILIAETKNINK